MIPQDSLAGRRILIIEDEYLLACDLERKLGDDGAVVLGPVATVDDAIALIKREALIDGAVVDVNLRGQLAYPAADLLLDRKVPFVFTTGYDSETLPERFGTVPHCVKPAVPSEVAKVIRLLLQP